MNDSIDIEEAKRLLKAIDLLATRLTEKEKKFIIDMVDHPEYEMTPGRVKWICDIAEKYNIM